MDRCYSCSQFHFLLSWLLVPGWRVDVAGDTGALGGPPAVIGQVSGGVELVVVEGGGRAPVAGDGAPPGSGRGGALGPGAGRGALVPPGVVDGGERVAQLGADGLGVAADQLADGFLAGPCGAGD